MKKINVNLEPKDGYFFIEKDGAPIRGTSWRAVMARLVSYRKRNKLPAGNPMEEVHAQACERNPNYCHETEDPVNKAALRVASLKGRALAWLSELRGRQSTLLYGDAVNMRARAAICAACPAHAAIAGGCGSCKKALKEARNAVLGDRPVDERLAGCSILGIDCGTAAWIDEPTSDNPELPGPCWRRSHPPA